MTRAKRDGLYILLSGALGFCLLACWLSKSPPESLDFNVIYYPTRCILRGQDPYDQQAVRSIRRREGIGDLTFQRPVDEEIQTRAIYPPTSFAVVLPFALMPWPIASLVWLFFTAVSLLLAAFLVWEISADYAPIPAAVLIAILLACGELILVLGNPAGIAIALCVTAVWCFFRERFVPAGVLSMAIALALKPHDVALVWLCFLLAGGSYRRRALQSLFVFAAFSLPMVVWIWRASPHWYHELQTNIAALSAPGGPIDLSPAPLGSRGGGVYINLQAALALFSNKPLVYNLITYSTCLVLLIVWFIVTMTRGTAGTNLWLGLATAAPLSMLPVYHHLLDAKLLLLAIPACSMLLAKRHPVRWIAFFLTAAGIFVTADLPWGVFLALTHGFRRATGGSAERLLLSAEILPAPITLLVMSVVFLWLQRRYVDELLSQDDRGRN